MTDDRMALRALRHLVAEAYGLEFATENLGDLRSALEAGLNAHRLENLESLFYRLEGEDPAGEAWRPLRERLMIGETFFFRDPAQLEVIRSRVLLPFVDQQPRSVRLWSAGCATGEEAYSLAILAREVLPESRGWQVEVLGTDIHTGFLARARSASYREWAFRSLDPVLRERWFRESRGRWELVPEVRHLVKFMLHNLVQDPIEALIGEGFDLILCRNVFIYFPPALRLQMALGFLKALRPGGAIVLGHGELGQDALLLFQVEHHPDSLVLRQNQPVPCSPSHSPRTFPPLERVPVERNLPHPAVESPPKPSDIIAGAKSALSKGDHVRALELARKVLDAKPRQEEGVRVAAQALANLGRLEEAMAILDESLVLNPMNPALNYLHSLLASEQGHQGNALRDLDRVLYLAPEHIAARMDRAHLFEVQQRFQEAVRDLNRALQLLGHRPPQELVEGLEPFRTEEVLLRCRELRERCLLLGQRRVGT